MITGRPWLCGEGRENNTVVRAPPGGLVAGIGRFRVEPYLQQKKVGGTERRPPALAAGGRLVLVWWSGIRRQGGRQARGSRGKRSASLTSANSAGSDGRRSSP